MTAEVQMGQYRWRLQTKETTQQTDVILFVNGFIILYFLLLTSHECDKNEYNSVQKLTWHCHYLFLKHTIYL